MMDIIGLFKGSPRVSAKMVVVGDAMIDEYYQVKANRVSPEFPIPVLKSEDMKPACLSPGGAANVVMQLRHFNADIRLVAFLDDYARRICEMAGINTKYCVSLDGAEHVPVKKRLYQGNFPLCRWDVEQECYGISDIFKARCSLKSQFLDAVQGRDVVVYSDYDKGVFNNNPWDIPENADYISIVDPKKGTPLLRWKGCQIFKPNAEEAYSLSGLKDWKEQCRFFQKELGCKATVITCGGSGVVGMFDDNFFEYHPKKHVKPESVVGAGDCFVAILGMALAKNYHLDEAVALAFEAGAVYVQKKHNQPVSTYDLHRHMDPLGAKFVSAEFLAEVAKRERLVFTNGVFDGFGLHQGHIATLRFAKSQGDKLVVAVNADRSAREIKGEGRPVSTLHDRMVAIAALQCVDFVVSFDEPSVLDLVRQICPALLVKGGDYERVEDVVGHEIAPVVIAPHVVGVSTTEILNNHGNNWKEDAI